MTDDRKTPAKASADAPKPNLMVERLKFLAIGLGVGLVIGGAGAGYVWFTGQAEVRELKAAAASELQQAEQSADELQQGLDKELKRASILSARVEIARARMSLEQMNYGIVTQRLNVAAQRLDGVPEAEEIVPRLKAVQIDPLAPEAAKGTIDSLAGDVDALIGR
ncbi:MAG: hypothetical protein EA397_19595 [Deltaproteobacteria bacterium]|nr:MAG: hypothetical protein EA397_19595 [Deltaproteobacteria bacterium]